MNREVQPVHGCFTRIYTLICHFRHILTLALKTCNETTESENGAMGEITRLGKVLLGILCLSSLISSPKKVYFAPRLVVSGKHGRPGVSFVLQIDQILTLMILKWL